MAEAFRKPRAAPHDQGSREWPELQTDPAVAAQAASSPPGKGPACRVGPASKVRPPLVVTVMAAAMAAMGLLVALLPVGHLLAGEDSLLGFGFALLGIGLMVVALCLLYWVWMWDSLRLVLVILALYLAFGEARTAGPRPVASRCTTPRSTPRPASAPPLPPLGRTGPVRHTR